MNQRQAWVLLTGLFLVLMLAGVALAADGKPLTMSEVGKLIEDKSTPQQVLELMSERGVGFRVTSTAEKRLTDWGFTAVQIELVRKIAAGEKIDLNAPPAEAGPGDEAGPGAKKDYPVGYPNADTWHQAEQKRIERAIKNAELGYKRIELSRCTLYCSDKRAADLVPMLKKLEADLIKRFPVSLVNACSPKSAHIVVVDGDSEWRRWVKACFDSYEEDRIRYRFGPEDDPRPQLIEGSGYYLPHCAVMHADALLTDERVSRGTAYSLGHLMMIQAGGEARPDALITGFGDLTEATAHGTPSIMVYSYEKRDLTGESAWKQAVAKLFKDKKITDAAGPWTFKTDAMSPEDYAQAWSLVSTLAEAPEKFAKAVEMVRNKEAAMGQAVGETFGLEDRKLLEAWYKWVNQ